MKDNHRMVVRYVSRRQFLKTMGVVAVGGAVGSALASCAPTAEPAPAPAEVGGQLDFYSWEGYDMLSATEAWRAEHNIDLRSAYIASSEDTPAKVLSPAGAGIDTITYAHPYFDSWYDLGVLSDFTVDEVPNIKRMYPYFQESVYWRRPDGNYIGVPLTWLNYVCNYRADMVDPPAGWSELLTEKYKDKVAVVEDPGALFLVASAVLGIAPETMNQAEFEEVKGWLKALVENAKTIAPSYGDLSNLLISGEVAATFVGWGALDVWGQNEGVDTTSVLPKDGVVTMVDAYAIPPETDNRAAALAWLNLMLTDEVQLSVANDLLTAVVTPDTVPLITDDNVRAMYDYDNFESLVKSNPPPLFPPNEATGDQVTFGDWLKGWEEIKAG
jgi:spermidine/putrescine transport system substrate-binding protein